MPQHHIRPGYQAVLSWSLLLVLACDLWHPSLCAPNALQISLRNQLLVANDW